MQWSKLKKRIESNFSEELKDRVTLFSTWYKQGGSPQRGRASVLLDKIEIYEANTDKWIMNRVNNEEVNDDILIERLEFHKLLEQYLNLSIEEALESKHVLIQGLAIIDKRLGKRRLINMNIIENQFVKKLYSLRCEIEGISIKNNL
ncbi:hypothetical protein [Paenibacillus terrigena]|uniref:SF0329 family protein n=1 Tax=Paenibacillus terrigena TaxID=369333 RepID=UPI0028D1B3BC|nr:hypothetical protein [Paenibacillus terrigena]